MHEYSIVQALFDRIGDVVREQRAASVKRVRVTIGDGAGVDPDLFRTAYGVFRIGTWCGEAPLDIVRVSGDDLTLDQLELEVP
jgi:Zn finger protein HypA/HybF involved in hydrogenase expression